MPYWEAREELTVHKDLLLHGTYFLVPAAMQQGTLNKLHAGHQGIERCPQHARIFVCWLGISSQINEIGDNQKMPPLRKSSESNL